MEENRGLMSANCDACGAKTVKYKFSLNRQIVDVLVDMYEEYGTHSACEIAQLGMSTSQWTNFQKLRYWGLIEKVKVDGVLKGGIWAVTDLGEQFVKNEVPLQKFVYMYRNEIDSYDGEMVYEAQIRDKKFKIKPEYVADAIPMGDSE
jgi:hypothetical protein